MTEYCCHKFRMCITSEYINKDRQDGLYRMKTYNKQENIVKYHLIINYCPFCGVKLS